MSNLSPESFKMPGRKGLLLSAYLLNILLQLLERGALSSPYLDIDHLQTEGECVGESWSD